MQGNQNELNQQLLREAATEGRLDEVRRLIKEGAAVNAKNKYGLTPLHFAALKGHIEIVKSLLGTVNKDLQSNRNNAILP